MFLLGVLSLFQITIIPGLLFLKLLKIKTSNVIQLSLYSFGLSLFLNYLIVVSLTALKIYIPLSMYTLFVIEVLLLVFLMIRGEIVVPWNKSTKDYYSQLKNYFQNISRVHKIALGISLFMLLFFVSVLIANLGTVFYFIDAIYRDRWIIAWSSNHFPLETGHYPQLLPVNMSMCYVFMQEAQLQFFPKAFMPLFFLGILFIFFDFALTRKSIVHLAGLITYGFILFVFYTLLFSADYNTDISTSFFGFLVFYVIKQQEKSGYNIKTILLIAIFASSAANTKLVGMQIVMLSILWIAYNIYKNKNTISKLKIAQTILLISVIFFGNLFWYLIRPDMHRGLDASPYIPYSSYYDRIINALNMLVYSFGHILAVYLLATLIFSVFLKETKYLIIFIIAPLMLVWTLFYSYDYRNLSVAIPFVAYSSAFGLQYFYHNNGYLKKFVSRINNKKSSGKTSDKVLLSLSFVIIPIAAFLIFSTNSFFNYCTDFSYIINKAYYMYYRTIYTTDLGYYKHVEYFVNTLRILSIGLLVIFFLRILKVKIVHIIIVAAVTLLVLNSTLLKKETLIQNQVNDIAMVKTRNLHYLVYSYIMNTGISGSISTNHTQLSGLIPPENIKFDYLTSDAAPETLNNRMQRNNNYLLLEKGKLNQNTQDYIKKQIAAKKYAVQFDNGEFIFLRSADNVL